MKHAKCLDWNARNDLIGTAVHGSAEHELAELSGFRKTFRFILEIELPRLPRRLGLRKVYRFIFEKHFGIIGFRYKDTPLDVLLNSFLNQTDLTV